MKKKSKAPKINAILVVAVIAFAAYWLMEKSSAFLHQTDNSAKQNIDRVEIPSKIAGRNERIIAHTGYTVSYNSKLKIPNWVAYELTRAESEGTLPRDDRFIPDPDIPVEESAVSDDYKNSGWDRGHMAPAADMKWSKKAMKESFYLSNICPQNRNLNAGIWKDLEEQVRGLAVQRGNIYVVCGPVTAKNYKTVGKNRVAIPDAFFKALLQNSGGKWAAIAFMFENRSGQKLLSSCAMSINEIEDITGIDFFPALPDSIENTVENQVDFSKWNVKK
jgi:endonuclease G